MEEYQDVEKFKALARSFQNGRGEVYSDFIYFVARKIGSKGAFVHEVTPRSLIGFMADATLPEVFKIRGENVGERNIDDDRLFERMLVESNRAFFGLFHLAIRMKSDGALRGRGFCTKLVAALLERVFMRVEREEGSPVLFVRNETDDSRNLATHCLSALESKPDGRQIALRWDEVMREYGNWLKGDPIRLGFRDVEREFSTEANVWVYWREVLSAIQSSEVRELVSRHFSAKASMAGVVTRGKQIKGLKAMTY